MGKPRMDKTKMGRADTDRIRMAANKAAMVKIRAAGKVAMVKIRMVVRIRVVGKADMAKIRVVVKIPSARVRADKAGLEEGKGKGSSGDRVRVSSRVRTSRSLRDIRVRGRW